MRSIIVATAAVAALLSACGSNPEPVSVPAIADMWVCHDESDEWVCAQVGADAQGIGPVVYLGERDGIADAWDAAVAR